MAQANHPSKDLVRNWLHQRQEQRSPPPSPEQVRRELGWELVEAERRQNLNDETRVM